MNSLFCYWKLLCPLICIANLFPFSLLLVRFYKAKYYKSFASTMVILINELKFQILVIVLLTNVVVGVVNGLYIPNDSMINQQLLMFEFICIFLGWYLVLFYIFKKASKGLPSKDRIVWINFKLKPLVIIGIIANTCEILWLEINIGFSKEDRGNKWAVQNLECTSPVWLTHHGFQFFTSLVFLLFVRQLKR